LSLVSPVLASPERDVASPVDRLPREDNPDTVDPHVLDPPELAREGVSMVGKGGDFG